MFVNLVDDYCSMSVLVCLVALHDFVEKGATESYVNHNAHQASVSVGEEIGAHFSAITILEEYLTVVVSYVHIINDTTSLRA